MKKKLIAKLLVLAMVAAATLPVAITAASAYYGDYSVGGDTLISSGDVKTGGTIVAKVENGVASVSLDDKAVKALAAQGSTWTIVAEGASKVNFNAPAKAMTAAAEKLGTDLTMVFGSVASVTIPKDILSTVFGSKGSAEISVQKDDVGNHFWSVQVNGMSLDRSKDLVFEWF